MIAHEGLGLYGQSVPVVKMGDFEVRGRHLYEWHCYIYKLVVTNCKTQGKQ